MIDTRVLHVSFFTPGRRGMKGLPLYFEGCGGVGKSELIEQYSRQWGFPFYCLSPAEDGEGAFGRVPVHQDGKIVYPQPDWLQEVFPDGEGILLLDDSTMADVNIQRPLHSLVNNRRIAGHQVGLGVRVVLAGNSTDQNSGFATIPTLANRYGHIQVQHGYDATTSWVDYMLGGVDQQLTVENFRVEWAKVEKFWPAAWGRARALGASYIKTNPTALVDPPKHRDPKASKAWASMRSWENGLRAIAGCELHGFSDLSITLFEAFVGKTAADGLFQYAEHLDLPDMARVLDGQERWVPDPARPDQVLVAFNAATTMLIGEQDKDVRTRRVSVLWGLMNEVYDRIQPDLMVPSCQALVKNNLSIGAGPEADKMMMRILPTLRAAGIMSGVTA